MKKIKKGTLNLLTMMVGMAPHANHQQAYSTGLPYLELFVWGKLPKPILEQQNPQ